jgi:hypothetical protein
MELQVNTILNWVTATRWLELFHTRPLEYFQRRPALKAGPVYYNVRSTLNSMNQIDRKFLRDAFFFVNNIIYTKTEDG